MRFADPQACPDCRGAIAGQPACPHCGLDLTSLEVRQLWQTLLQADDLLARAARKPRAPVGPRDPVTPPAAPTMPAPTATQEPTRPAPTPPQTPVDPVREAAPPFVAAPAGRRPYPTPGPAAPAAPGGPPPPQTTAAPGRSWSVGTILLVLGAFGLVVAGLIFVTRSWEDIGLAGRTLILLGVTAVIGALGIWVTRRPLRASAEAVWAVFLALLTLDVFAARHEDLLGLRGLRLEGAWIAWGVIALALSLTIAVWARPHVKTALIVPAVAAGVSITIAGIGAGALGDDWDVAWRAILALVVAGLLALSTRPAGLAPTTLAARIVVAGFFAFAYLAAAQSVADNPALSDLVGGGHGVPLLLMGAASVVIGWLVPVVRIPAVALAVVAVGGLGVAPVVDAGGEASTWTVVAVLSVALAALGARGRNDWMRGVRLGALPAVAGIVIVHLRLTGDAIETITRGLADPWSVEWDRRLDVSSVADHAAWVVPVVLVALLATTWFVAHWPEAAPAAPHAPALVGSAMALGAATAVVALRWPVWVVAWSLIALAAVFAVVRARRIVSVPSPVTALLLLAGSALAAASHGVSATTWLAGGLVLVVVAFVTDGDELRPVYAFVGVALIVGGIAALVELIDIDDAVTPLVAVVASIAMMSAAQFVRVDQGVGPAIEIAAGIGLGVALVMPGTAGEFSVRWTIAGASLIGLGMAVAGRRWFVWPGLAALIVAYVALVLDSGFSFVEAYTLPLGVAVLAVGLVLTPRKPDIGTWTLLGPGLAVSLLPSVPQALADPTEVRALVLGVGALVVLAVGVRWSWQAPFVAGVMILTLLVLFNIGPYANAAPRVVLIAAVSAVLLGIGITWEDRVQDGRKLVHYVRSMR